MGLPIERWARQATLLDTPPKRLLDDVGDLAHFEQQFWRNQTAQIWRAGGPVAVQSGFAGLMTVPPAADIANVASINGTVALWTSSLYTPIGAQVTQAPQAFRIVATGKTTTAATPGNIGFDPRLGTGSTGGSAIAGTTIGASTNVALTASITASFWTVYGDITIRSVGQAGANTTVFGHLSYIGTQATTLGLAGPAVVGAGHNLMFGGTQASVDLSIAGGFSLGAVHTVTTITHTPQQIHWASWN